MRTVSKLAPPTQAPTACRFCGNLTVLWDWQPEDGWQRVCLACNREDAPPPAPLPFLRNGATQRIGVAR